MQFIHSDKKRRLLAHMLKINKIENATHTSLHAQLKINKNENQTTCARIFILDLLFIFVVVVVDVLSIVSLFIVWLRLSSLELL
jgi:hypothetical protein